MELIDKARILAEAWWRYRDDLDEQLLEHSDLGFPYAFGIAEGDILGLSAAGEDAINETWDAFCKSYDLDTDGDYDSIDELGIF